MNLTSGTSEMKKSILKLLLLVVCLGAICVGAYFILKALKLDDIDTLREVVNNGAWGVIIYILLQVFQVIFIPINTTIFTVPAIILFGPVKAFFVSWIGCSLGSIVMFILGRYGGSKLLKWIVGEEKAEHYANALGKTKFILPIFLLVPIFPDDILCASAGLAKINMIYFIIVITVTRAIDTACTCFIGASMVQSTLGIVLLCIFVAIMLGVSIILTKKQDKIENWFVRRFTKTDVDNNEEK